MRYLPLTDTDRREMCAAIGVPAVDALYADVPAPARLPGPIAGLPLAMSEMEVEAHIQQLAAANSSPSPSRLSWGRGRIAITFPPASMR